MTDKSYGQRYPASPGVYDVTVAMVAGTLLSGLAIGSGVNDGTVQRVAQAVAIARLIVAEVKRTDPS